MADIEAVWDRIVALQGEQFHQLRGQAFTYVVVGSATQPSTTKQNIGKPSSLRPWTSSR